ncbi:Pentatricopeptide repeat-containing protein [Thalictrum thalictroides]|uniref:Pentatricopeptide repeat-containing protein n=1 Tax=Thalictrum thalictroides TaxID=46969 RepID=A0A7J6WTK8_THATH|nr:Pentatricopeptide repeat-containing protein [Thalictrum thalictroides]
MIRSYIENNRVGEARDLFDRMSERNDVTWNSMIMAYTQEKKLHIALKLFFVMPDKDVVSWTSIVSGLCRSSCVVDAYRLFMQMPERNSVSWSAIISGFQHNGFAFETLSLFKDMLLGGVQPTSHCFTSALTASAELAALSVGEQLYCQLVKGGFEGNHLVGNSAITMFMKSGSFDNARRVFLGMPLLDLVTWNSMIVGYGQHGHGVEAILTFHQMQKACFCPDDISFLGVLQGCTHCGYVEEAMRYFRSMQIDYGIPPGPEHYMCMVDVLARAGSLKEALDMIHKMPFEPGAIFWRTLLNGCRIWRDFELGEFAADQILKLEPYSASVFLMVIDMYTYVGRFADVAEIRRQMRERGARQEVAHSWVEVQGRVNIFTTKDETHVESDNIYTTLQLLAYGVAEHIGR